MLFAAAYFFVILIMSLPAFADRLHGSSPLRLDFESGQLDWVNDWDTGSAGDRYSEYYRVDRLRAGYLVHDRQSYCSPIPHDYLHEQAAQVILPWNRHGFWNPVDNNWVSLLTWTRDEGWYGAGRHDWQLSVELEEGALMAAEIVDLGIMDECLKRELEYMHANVNADGSIARLTLDKNAYEYGVILSAFGLGAHYFANRDAATSATAFGDTKMVFQYVAAKYPVPFRASESTCTMLRGSVNAWRAFDTFKETSLRPQALGLIGNLSSLIMNYQEEDGAYSLSDTSYRVQRQLKADIGLMLAYRVTSAPRCIDAVERNIDWIVACRWDDSEKRMGGIMWCPEDSVSYFECHQMWFLIATKYLEECAPYSCREYREDAFAFLTDDNFAGVDMFTHNADTYGAFFAYRAISRDGTIQKDGFHQWKGAYEIGASLWALALNYDERTEGHSWLMTQAPEDSSDGWDKAIYTARDFGPGCMVFRWDAKFRDVRYPGAFTGLLNDRYGDWRILFDTTHGFSYRDVHDSTRVLVDARAIASNRVYTVTVDRISVHRTRMALEEGDHTVCDVEVTDLKPYRSCYFSVLQNNGGGLSAKNIWVDNVSYTPKEGLPEETCLRRCFPNPFNGGTWIEYDVKGKSPVRILVFDVSGHLMAELAHGAAEAGHHRVFWDGTDRFGRRATSGVYYCAFKAPGLNQSAKLVLLR